MKLEKYLEKYKLSQAEFARQIGRHRLYVHRLVNGAQPKTAEDMAEIYRATKGKVTPNDFYLNNLK